MIKTIIWSLLFTCGICLTANGETINKPLQTSDSCGSICSELKLDSKTNFNNRENENLEPTQLVGDSGRRSRYIGEEQLKKIYLGGTIGLFLPSDVDTIQFSNDDFNFDSVDSDNGIGGSIYAGYKFNNFLSADLELLAFTGNAEPFDSDYTAAGFFLNPRYTLPIGGNPNASLYVFASPGIGIAGVGFGDEIEDRINEDNLNTGVAIQLKAGAGLPLSESIDVFGQARYFNAFKVYEISTADGNEEEDGFSSFSLEAGVNFKL